MAKELAVSSSSAALPVTPDFLMGGDYVVASQQVLSSEDMITPRIKVVQAMAKQAKGNKMAIGTFMNLLTEETMENFEAYNLGFVRTYIVSDRGGDDKDKSKGGIFKVFNDDQHEQAEQFARENGCKCELSHRHFLMRADIDDLTVYAFDMAGSFMRISKALNSLIVSKFGNVPRQAPVWTFSIEEVEFNGNDWFVPKIEFSGRYVASKAALDGLIDAAKGIEELRASVTPTALLN
jgi:hypothetical protein